MRILYVSNMERDPSSGAAGTLISLGEEFVRAGHEVRYVWNDPTPFHLPHPALQRAFELPRRQLRETERALAASPADVVIVNQPYAFLIYERLAPLHPRTLFLNQTQGWEERHDDARRRFAWDGRPRATTRLARALSSRLTSRICARAARTCHGLIAQSSLCAKFIETRYGVAADKIRVVPQGFEQDRFANVERPAHEGGTRLIFVGNYIPLKGTAPLEALLPPLGKKFPDARLTFVVNDQHLARIRSIYGPTWGDRLTASGWVDRARMPEIYARHDVLLHPSYFEGGGGVVIEALAAGVCPLTSSEGVVLDVAPGGKGILVHDAGDDAELGRLLERALADPAGTRALGENGRALVRELSWADAARRTLDFVRDRRAALGMGPP